MTSETYSKALAREKPTIESIVSSLSDCLPEQWKIAYEPFSIRKAGFQRAPDSGRDGALVIEGPDRELVKFIVEAKVQSAPLRRDISVLLEKFALPRDADARDSQKFMYLARYISPQARARLEEAGIAYADATGNAWLVASRPGLVIRISGLDKDPWRGPGRARESLSGAPAARVVRALMDIAPPILSTSLIRESHASAGSTYRILQVLEDQRLLTRSSRGTIEAVDWAGVFEAWVGDASKDRWKSRRGWLLPRGVQTSVETLLRTSEPEFVVGGSVAANMFASLAEESTLTVHARDAEAVARVLGAVESATATNLLVYEDDYEYAKQRSKIVGGLPIAAASQAAFDLAAGPGREPVEGEQLINWMKRNEDEWRRQPAN